MLWRDSALVLIILEVLFHGMFQSYLPSVSVVSLSWRGSFFQPSLCMRKSWHWLLAGCLAAQRIMPLLDYLLSKEHLVGNCTCIKISLHPHKVHKHIYQTTGIASHGAWGWGYCVVDSSIYTCHIRKQSFGGVAQQSGKSIPLTPKALQPLSGSQDSWQKGRTDSFHLVIHCSITWFEI